MRYVAYLAILLALPLAAPAADLVFEFQGQGLYDSNVFRSKTNERDDYTFRIRPGLRLEEKRGHTSVAAGKSSRPLPCRASPRNPSATAWRLSWDLETNQSTP